MKPIVFVDLDRTIFDTVGFFSYIEEIMANHFSITEADLVEKIRPLYAVQSPDPMLRYSDFDQILELLHITKEELQQVVIETAGKNTFILPDAVNFIAWLKLCTTHEVRILSFGQDYFQRLKLHVSPVLSEFPDHIIMQRKNEFISTAFTHRVGILVDDKPNQELPIGWKEIFIDRARTTSIQYNQSDYMIRITTLADAPKYIHSAHS